MNQLTKYLISELLDGKTVTTVYGGGFKPPTKGHFDLVKKALDDNKEIDKKCLVEEFSKIQEALDK